MVILLEIRALRMHFLYCLESEISKNYSAHNIAGHDVPEVMWFASSRKALISPECVKEAVLLFALWNC